MVATPFTAVGTASAVLALSKVAWKLGSSLSKLDQDTRIVDITVRDLAGEVKSLSNKCDLVYAELEEVVNKSEAGTTSSYDVDGRMWDCLATQVEETSRTMQELELFAKSAEGEANSFTGQAQRQRKLDKSKDQIASIRTQVCKHTDNLRTTILLINTVFAYIVPYQADREIAKEVDKLQNMVEKLQRSSGANSQSRLSHADATLMQYAREVIVKGTTMYEAILAAESVARGQGAANSNLRVAEWVSILESIRRDQDCSDPSDMVSNAPSTISGDAAHTIMMSVTSTKFAVQERESGDAVRDDSDDDLEVDLAKAALDTGTKAFEAQNWEDADSLLQEAIRVLQQLPKQQRAFRDILGLQYKLSVCAYYMQEPADAEEALIGLVQQLASSDEQRGYIYDAAHLLSHLYIRMGQVDRARSQCEKALQGRRRLLGKQSDASLESTALMAHIYVLLNNRARATSYMAMIPEARRDAVLQIVKESLATKSRLSTSSLALPMETRSYKSVPAMISQSPAASLRRSYQRILSNKAGLEDLQSVTVTSLASREEKSGSRAIEKNRANEGYSADPETPSTATLIPGEPPEADETFKGKTLSRNEILNKIGCQPRDQIEEAVCNSDHSAFDSLLNSKKDFWRSKLRKRVRSERVTALHFAALFGEIDMARRLLGSSFNINEVPHGYSTRLTHLKFAIGARQVDMVEFLIANGAKPSEPDSWSTLAGQLMNRSWLMKTTSEAEQEHVPKRIIAILRILLKHGWDVNAPFETSGGTVLHQAVSFWTGSYKWDLNLRAVVTSFLCERGADPFQANTEGKTPYNMAMASGHQELLLVLDQGSKKKKTEDGLMEPFELSS
ncbi:hypothetical protein BDZ45DRAFT_734130 [Acephala macrosclerotiorum]|nr:hypothetical protein BDZ45DRAFT_734130 [Acephala macrosclerotiorum]